MRIFSIFISILFFIVILIVFLFKNPCKERISYNDIHINWHLDRNQLLNPPDSNDISTITEQWDTFNYASEEFQVIKETSYSLDRKLLIIEHEVDEYKHYAALILPRRGFIKDSTDLLIIASGLDQRNPVVNLNRNYWLKRMENGCADMAMLIPAFRGQALKLGFRYHCSDGFFGDAYDGAAIDALRAIDVVEKIYPTISRKVYVYGISRGANVAALMAARRGEIEMIIAQSGPYDFMGEHAYNKYGFQYRYQFLSRAKGLEKIREKIVSSSPIYFNSRIKSDVLIIHGRNDQICDFEKAKEFYHAFPSEARIKFKWVEGGHNLDEFSYVIEQINMHRMGVNHMK